MTSQGCVAAEMRPCCRRPFTTYSSKTRCWMDFGLVALFPVKDSSVDSQSFLFLCCFICEATARSIKMRKMQPYQSFFCRKKEAPFFTDILAGFTFNNRVLRLPTIVLLNMTFWPGNLGPSSGILLSFLNRPIYTFMLLCLGIAAHCAKIVLKKNANLFLVVCAVLRSSSVETASILPPLARVHNIYPLSIVLKWQRLQILVWHRPHLCIVGKGHLIIHAASQTSPVT